MPLADLLTDLRGDASFMAKVAAWRTLPPLPARLGPIPAALHPALVQVLQGRGLAQLYTHQVQSVELALAGRHLAVVTPTASGKTLCYNLPVFHTLLADSTARALYLFPTKALAQDQLAELHRLATEIERSPIRQLPNPPISQPLHLLPATYDGDTPSAARSRIRKTARLILSNPDMLHTGILPYHPQWAEFLGGLRWVVIDEMHTYRGVFGSHVANVLRRLQRLCAHYGSRPQFICTSATIANPAELAQRLIEQPVRLVDDNGAPRGARHILLVNPPIVDADRGLRRSATLEAADLAARCLQFGLQTIVFGRSRLTTELLLTYLRERVASGEGRGAEVVDDEVRADQRGARGEGRGATGDEYLPGGAEVVEDETRAGRGASHLKSATHQPTHQPTHLSPLATRHSPPAPRPSPLAPLSIHGYRGGYLASERRAIEAGLRSGEIRAAVATNALELGIDIGQLQAAVLCGYPGSIASTWQQIGRAGRTTEGAVAILVASGSALDQYIIQHPEFLFERSPEHALVNPDNLMLLLDQLHCAAYELPFRAGEAFGASAYTDDVLQLLAENGDLHAHEGNYFWSGTSYPARAVSLRSASADSVLIQAATPSHQSPLPSAVSVIGAVDSASAPLLVHEGAIYLHEGQSFRVERLDLEALRADVVPVQVDYYTEALSETDVAILQQHAARETAAAVAAFGDVTVTSQVAGYRRIKRHTHETLGVQQLGYPPRLLDTSAYWCAVQPAAQAMLERAGLWFDSANDYGPNWQTQRAVVRARDHYRCSQCGAPEAPGQEHDVHHRVPLRAFGYVPGLNDRYLQANLLENLVLVCRTCHQRLETAGRLRTGLDGLAYALANLAPLHLMCDRADLGIHVTRSERQGVGSERHGTEQDQGSISGEPGVPAAGRQLATIYLYERVPAGLGFSALLFDLHDTLLAAAHALIGGCPCPNGCPACVGPVIDDQPVQLETKRLTMGLVEAMRAGAATC